MSDVSKRARDALNNPKNLDLALNPEPLMRDLLTENDQLRAVIEELININRDRRKRLDAALTELAHHGDLTPSGKRALQQILGGEA